VRGRSTGGGGGGCAIRILHLQGPELGRSESACARGFEGLLASRSACVFESAQDSQVLGQRGEPRLSSGPIWSKRDASSRPAPPPEDRTPRPVHLPENSDPARSSASQRLELRALDLTPHGGHGVPPNYGVFRARALPGRAAVSFACCPPREEPGRNPLRPPRRHVFLCTRPFGKAAPSVA